MASTVTKLLVHVTFSTRNRAPLITPGVEPDLYAYVGGICRRFDSPLLAMGGVADHVHMLVSLSKNIALSAFMLDVKRDSSKRLHRHVPAFRWQEGYFAFSIGESAAASVTAYIARQKQRHARVSFQDEVRAFFKKYGLTCDERHVWS